MTQRIEPSFHKWLEDLNFLLQICLIESNFFFWKKKDDSKNWFSENINQNIETILMTQRIELLVKFNLSYMIQRIELSRIWLKELNPFDLTRTIESFFLKVTHRIELFLNVTHRIELFFLKVTQRIEPFWKMTPRIDFLNQLVFGWDSKNWLF